MPIKGVIQPDIVQVNKYLLTVPGMPPLVIIAISGIEEELDVSDLPDRTKATGGRTKPVEYDITIPAHHSIEQYAMEQWFDAGKDPVTPDHKRLATLTLFSQMALPIFSVALTGTFPTKRALPDLELENDGEMAGIVWSMSSDEVIRL
jgi:hypothetical protein